MQGATGTLDGIIDTVSAEHPIAPLLSILKPHGKLVMVGLPPKPLELPVFPLLMGKKNTSIYNIFNKFYFDVQISVILNI